jgi:DNA-binding transcriptional ArsR family regulator/uncharacterized protein YndB with AHSA1/START domain
VEPVFKALSDQTRRELLDELFRHDGQTLNALAGRFDMTRVAVAKHLRLLEAAGLVVSRRSGREKLHYLNPVPIRLVHDRWVNKYTEGWAAGLADLKRDMEANVEKVFEIYIRTTPEQLWRAITDPDVRARYQFGARVESSWTPGSSYQVTHQGAPRSLIEGENLEDDDIAAEGTSRVTWEIESVGDSCRLTVTHDQLRENADPHLYGGWPMILSGLKTWLETGQELTTPGSLTYGGTT